MTLLTVSGASAPHTFDVFLSHNSSEKPTVERLAEMLKRDAVEPWLDNWCLTPGGDWQDELAEGLRRSSTCAVFVGPAGIGDWARLEFKLAIDRMAKDRNFRVFLVLLPGLPEPFDTSTLPPFLTTRTWVDMRKGIGDPRTFQNLINAVRGLPPGPERPIAPRNDVCPYRGLRAFDEEHAEFFFGREADIQRLVEKLKTTRFLTVLGPSGSGKSSLVRAGLVPALHKGRLPGTETWTVQIFKPGARPLTQLAANLVRFHPASSAIKTLDELASDERALHLACSVALAERPEPELVVLVVDQFEEVFTVCRDEAERAKFISNLLYAAGVPGGRALVVLTMRADFYQKCAAYPELSAQVSAQQFLVSPMSAEGFRQAITEPAWRVGLEFEPGLVSRILRDVELQPDSLPLLEFALRELWENREGYFLTHKRYEEIGGVEGAINRRADSVLASLSPDQQNMALYGLLKLVRVSIEETEGSDTRRRVRLADLNDTSRLTLQPFVDGRLLVTNRNEITGEETIEVAHETLIRRWGKLREALDKDREFLLWLRRLRLRMKEWKAANRDNGALLQGALLAEAKRYLFEREDELTKDERDFITWAERDEYQVQQIIAKSYKFFRYLDEEQKGSWVTTIVSCSQIDYALHCTFEIKDLNLRDHILTDMAGILTGLGFYEEALAAAREIKDEHTCGQLLMELSVALSRAENLDKALAVTLEIKDERSRVQALLDISGALTRSGLREQALAVAYEIKDASYRTLALMELTGALSQEGRHEEVLAAAQEIKDAHFRSSILMVIARAMAGAGFPEQAEHAAEQSLAAAMEVGYPSSRSELFKEISIKLSEVRLYEQSLAAAMEVEDERSRMQALTDILGIMCKAGDREEVKRLSEQIFSAPEEVKDKYSQAQTFLRMSKALSNAKLREQTARAIEQAFAAALALKIEKRDSCVKALTEVSVAMFRDRLREQAVHAVEEAMSAAQEINDVTRRTEALAGIVEAMIGVGAKEQAERAAEQAFVAADQITNNYSRIHFREKISVDLRRLSRSEQSSRAPVQAHTDGREQATALTGVTSVEEYYRMRVIMGRSLELATGGILQQSESAAKQALIAALEIKDNQVRDAQLTDLSVIFSEVGLHEEALAAAQEIRDVHSRSSRLAGVARAMAGAGFREQAEHAAEQSLAAALKIEERYPRAQALTQASIALAGAGLHDRALAVALKVEDERSRNNVLTQMCRNLLQAERYELVLTAAAEVKDASYRAQALTEALAGMVRAGLSGQAERAAEQSFAAALEIEEVVQRTEMLASIASVLINAGFNEQGQRVATEYRTAIDSINYDGERSREYMTLSELLAKAGQYYLAHESADQCSSSLDRLQAYTAILQEYSRKINSEK